MMYGAFGILEDKKVINVDVAVFSKVNIFSKENWDKRIVGRDVIDDVTVSTVFLGINHGIEKPLWFETMIFDGPDDGLCRRYQTWEQAELGHAVMVEATKYVVERKLIKLWCCFAAAVAAAIYLVGR